MLFTSAQHAHASSRSDQDAPIHSCCVAVIAVRLASVGSDRTNVIFSPKKPWRCIFPITNQFCGGKTVHEGHLCLYPHVSIHRLFAAACQYTSQINSTCFLHLATTEQLVYCCLSLEASVYATTCQCPSLTYITDFRTSLMCGTAHT